MHVCMLGEVVGGGRILNSFAGEQVPSDDSLTNLPAPPHPPQKSGTTELALLLLRMFERMTGLLVQGNSKREIQKRFQLQQHI